MEGSWASLGGSELKNCVVSVYAPMFRASVEQKEQFFSDLQAKLDDVNEHDVLLLVGDFNARVGSSVRC